MKKLVLCLLVMIPMFLFAQKGERKLSKDFKVSTGDPYKVVDARSKEYFSTGDGGAILVKTRGEDVYVQKYDVDKMKEVARNEYTDFPKYSKLQKVLEVKDNLYYIFEAYNKKEKTYTLYYREVNKDDATLGKITEVFTTPTLVTHLPIDFGAIQGMSIFGLGWLPKFEISTSYDQSKILVRYRVKPTVKNDAKNNDVLGFYVFDSEMQKIWGREVKMPYTEKEMNNLAYIVGSEGGAYMLAFKREEKKVELFSITMDDFKVHKLDVKADLVFQNFDLREKADGDIACAGVYANGLDFKGSYFGVSTSFNTNGIYYFEMNKDGKVLVDYDYEFPLELIQQYLNKRGQKKAEKREDKDKAGINDLKLVKFLPQPDGGALFIGEQQYARKELWGTSSTMVYHYWHMVALRIDAEGNLMWMKKLPKNQAGITGQGQMSFQYVAGEDCHYVIYVGNPKNIDLSKDEVPAAHKDGMGGFLTAYKVDDKTGDWEKHTVLDLVDINGIRAYQFKVTRIFGALEKTFMMEAYIKGKKDAMIKMELLR